MEKVIKKIPKDRYTIAIPYEMLKAIGVGKGDDISICLDKDNNRIILTSHENDSEVILVNENQEENDISNTNEQTEEENHTEDLVEENPINLEENEVNVSDYLKSETRPLKRCYYCHRELDDKPKLKVNGHEICSECKNLEVQKFLLYLERRKMNEGR